MDKDTGGPAFPFNYEEHGKLLSCNGMTLRDWFAGQALIAVLKQYAESNGGIGQEHLLINCPVHAYRIADAMIAERSKP